MARGRGRGRGGRGRGRCKKEKIVSSDEENEQSLDGTEYCAENLDATEAVGLGAREEDTCSQDIDNIQPIASQSSEDNTIQVPEVYNANVSTIYPIKATVDMEADISQLEAPTFTTISRATNVPMLHLKWDHKVNLIGEKVSNPMIHCCDQCNKPILIYGRMIPCKHIFCLKCARTEPVKICPRCNDKVVRVEQSGLGTVFLCTHGGSRYGSHGCRRTYLSQRDLQAHINHRHVTQLAAPLIQSSQSQQPSENVIDSIKSAQRSVPDSSVPPGIAASGTISQRLQSRAPHSIGSIPPPGVALQTTSASTLTAANLARINNANAQDCHQGKVTLTQTLKKGPSTQTHHQMPETVADASYYSSVLNSFGSGAGGNNASSVPPSTNANSTVNYSTYEGTAPQPGQGASNTWSSQSQYYR